MRTACPRATKRRANSYERVPPTPVAGDEELMQVEDPHRARPNASRALDLVVAGLALALSSPLLRWARRC